MLCERCRKTVATIHITRIQDGHSTKEDLCEECGSDFLKELPPDAKSGGWTSYDPPSGSS